MTDRHQAADPLSPPGFMQDDVDVRRRRNRRNKANGADYERYVRDEYRKHGHDARRTGPLQQADDVIVGELFAVQTKKDKSLSMNKAHAYIKRLADLYPNLVPIVVHAIPGDLRGSIVIWRLSDHVAMHGEDGLEEQAA